MNLKEIRELALGLMRKYDLSDWTFKWGDDKRMERRKGGYTFGKTSYKYKEILLSRSITKHDISMDRVMNTILHEIAHAIDFKQRGKSAHDDIWRDIAKSIGCNADELTSLDTVDMDSVSKWIAQCNVCDKKYYTQKRPKTGRSCSDCDKAFNPDFRLNFTMNPRVVKTYESFKLIKEFLKNEKYSKFELTKILRNIQKICNKRPQFNYDGGKLDVLNIPKEFHDTIWVMLNKIKNKLLKENIMLSIISSEKYQMEFVGGAESFDMEPNKDIVLTDYHIIIKDIILSRVTVPRYIYHMSLDKHTDSIKRDGLKPGWGQNWAESGESINTEHPPAIFAIIDNVEDKWRGEVQWRIDTTLLDNKWYQDLNFHYNKNIIMTFDAIPPNALEIINHPKHL